MDLQLSRGKIRIILACTRNKTSIEATQKRQKRTFSEPFLDFIEAGTNVTIKVGKITNYCSFVIS